MAGNKRKYKASWRIDGIEKKVVEAGEIVELDPEDAKPLVQLRALIPVNEPKPEGDGKAGGQQPAK